MEYRVFECLAPSDCFSYSMDPTEALFVTEDLALAHKAAHDHWVKCGDEGSTTIIDQDGVCRGGYGLWVRLEQEDAEREMDL